MCVCWWLPACLPRHVLRWYLLLPPCPACLATIPELKAQGKPLPDKKGPRPKVLGAAKPFPLMQVGGHPHLASPVQVFVRRTTSLTRTPHLMSSFTEIRTPACAGWGVYEPDTEATGQPGELAGCI